ncbi:MAG: chemotaxis protein CheB [Planctomycetota bacterium]
MYEDAPPEPVIIVGIGASAGGLEPLEKFFSAAPPDTGMAYVVVQHLSPDYPSLMAELLARHTKMTILRVEDGMNVQPDTVYLIPPRVNIIVKDRILRLAAQERKDEHPPYPIDIFLRSLAEDRGERSAAVILSGTGSDGSRGVRTIKERGGLVLVQDKVSAKFSGMPQTAVDSGSVDAELAPEEMPSYLQAYLRDPEHLPTISSNSLARQDAEPDHVNQVLNLLNQHHGIDFSLYKPSTVHRRIDRRILLSPQEDIDAYLRRLRTDEAELNRLYNDLLIGVTHFFRDVQAFESLSRHVVPRLFDTHNEQDEIRVWVAGCATGEEAYSIAILLDEARDKLGRKSQPIRVFATDAHRTSIDFASVGRYEVERLRNVMPDRLAKYFLPTGDAFQVTPRLRHLVTFATHNLITDAPFTRMDLVTCRNVLIYFRQPAQSQVLSLLHFSLATNGFMQLGPSETPHPYSEEFDPVDTHWRVYQKRRDIRLLPAARLPIRTPAVQRLPAAPVSVLAAASNPDVHLLGAYDALLEDVIDNAVLINDNRDVLHIFGGATDLIQTPTGRRTNDLLRMLHESLRPAVGAAILRARSDGEDTRVGSVRVDESNSVMISAKSFVDTLAKETYTLVRFDRVRPNNPKGDPEAIQHVEYDPEGVNQEAIVSLEQELQYTKENLQTTIEELETANEELNATNEELIASNEELQSTNEELHSVNEELHTVNAEYQQKITELTQLTDDMNNLLASTEIGTLFLDPQMRVRRYTPAMQGLINLRETDIGRPLEEIRPSFDYDGVIEDAKAVLKSETSRTQEMDTEDGRHFLVRFNPYVIMSGGEKMTDGVVVTFVDVTDLREAEHELESMTARFEAFMQNSPVLKWSIDEEGRFIFVNEAFERALRLSAKQVIGKKPKELFRDKLDPELIDRLHASDEEVFGQDHPIRMEISLPLFGSDYSFYITKFPFRDAAGQRFIGGSAVDITELKTIENELKHINIELEDRVTERTLELKRAHDQMESWVEKRTEQLIEKNQTLATRNSELDQFAHAASHDLSSPLRTIQGFAEHLRESIDLGNQDEANDALNRIDAAAQRMSQLVEKLLLFATVGRGEFDPQPVDLNTTLAQVRSDLERELEECDARLDVPAELPVVTGDPAMLRQVIQNLISNAVKYRGEQRPDIQITSEVRGGQDWVRIKDNGSGFEPNQADRLFMPFQRLSKTHKKRGSGIGLSICKRVIDRHGGTIDATSKPGMGATFSFSLPRPKPAPSEA